MKELLPEEENKWFIKIWYDRETGKHFNTISILWNEELDGKWEWEGNKKVTKEYRYTEREYFNKE